MIPLGVLSGALDSAPSGGLTTLFSDDFNRANGALGANWVDQRGAWEVRSNGAACVSGATLLATQNTTVLPNDQWAQVTVITYSAGWPAVAVRMSGPGDWYHFGHNPSGYWTIDSRAGGANNTVASVPAGQPTPPFVLRLEVEGTSLRGYVNDVLTVSGTDSNLTTGKGGLFVFNDNTTPHFDNFSAGSL